MRFFNIDLPVVVRTEGREEESRTMTVGIVMGDGASAEDAVQALARKLEERCNTTDIGDCT